MSSKRKTHFFTIVDHADIRPEDKPKYDFGVHKLWVHILYSPPGGQNEIDKWFDVVVTYNPPRDFKLTVKPMKNRKQGK